MRELDTLKAGLTQALSESLMVVTATLDEELYNCGGADWTKDDHLCAKINNLTDLSSRIRSLLDNLDPRGDAMSTAEIAMKIYALEGRILALEREVSKQHQTEVVKAARS